MEAMSVVEPGAKLPTQRQLSEKISKAQHQKLLQSFPRGTADRARLEALCEPHAASWLQALPDTTPFDNRLDSAQFRMCLKLRLGVPFDAERVRCRYCAVQLDTAGHHALTCLCQAHPTIRHNNIRNRVGRLCSSASISYQIEKGGDDRRPADMLLRGFAPSGRDAALDFTVTSPLSDEHLHRARVADAVISATSVAEARKHSENDAVCKGLKWQCMPVAVNVYGGWGKESLVTLDRIVAAIASATQEKKAAASSFVFNTLGVVLARANATALLARYKDGKVLGSEVRASAGYR